MPVGMVGFFFVWWFLVLSIRLQDVVSSVRRLAAPAKRCIRDACFAADG
jgi:hypothetical protein